MMATPNLLKRLVSNIWLIVAVLVVCTIFSIYLLAQPPTVPLNLWLIQLNTENARIFVSIAVFVLGLFIAGAINILTSRVQNEASSSAPPQVIVPPIEIKNIIAAAEPITPSPGPSFSNQKFFPAPFLPDLKFFVGRKELLEKIKQTLATDHRVAIHDISGLGKTFTSYKFVEENQANYDKIFFIRATKEEMLESLAKCGEMVNPGLSETTEQQAKALGFKQWLEENEKWLVVYDNVDEPASLRPFAPVSKNGDCLFTSNFKDVTNLGTDVSIAKLDRVDAETLLYSRAYNRPHSLPQIEGNERAAFNDIINEIDGLPLTLNSTGAFICQNSLTFAEFKKIFEESVWDTEDVFDDYKNKKQSRSAGKVFSLVYDELCKNEKTGEAVKLLLDSMCLIAPDEIPAELLLEILKQQYGSYDKIENIDAFWVDVRKGLTTYDLLKYDNQKQVFNTHRGIQKVIQGRNSERAVEMYTDLAGILLSFFPKYDYSNRAICEGYYQHVFLALENMDKLRMETEKTNILYYRLGRYQDLIGNFSLAEKFYARAMQISAVISGTDSADYAIDLNNLAGVFESQGRYDEAIEKYEEALRIDEKALGKEHTDYGTDLSNLANVYESLGRYDEAIEKLEEALGIDEKTVGKEHPDYATHLNNLANVFGSQGRYNEAIEKYEEALRIDEKTLGKEHPNHAVRLSNLAGIYENRKEYAKALELYIEALRINQKTLPPNHPYTVQDQESVERCRRKLKNS